VKNIKRPDALFHDPLAKKLVGDRGKYFADSMADMSRYMEWSVISRTVIIDRFIEQMIKEGVDAVINLGAGLDTRPYRMNLPETFEWVEVDYSAINKDIRHCRTCKAIARSAVRTVNCVRYLRLG
jgi:O-methyltransferase involved in polyketide biosynthesis